MTLILLVEDELDVRFAVEMVLEDAGYSVMLASNGAEALQRITERRPDLILTDLMMPILDGEAFLQRVRASRALRDIPVVIMTAADGHETAARFHARHLAKPFMLEALRAEVEKALDRDKR